MFVGPQNSLTTKNFLYPGITLYCIIVFLCCSAKGENVDVKTLGQDEESGNIV